MTNNVLLEFFPGVLAKIVAEYDRDAYRLSEKLCYEKLFREIMFSRKKLSVDKIAKGVHWRVNPDKSTKCGCFSLGDISFSMNIFPISFYASNNYVETFICKHGNCRVHDHEHYFTVEVKLSNVHIPEEIDVRGNWIQEGKIALWIWGNRNKLLM